MATSRRDPPTEDRALAQVKQALVTNADRREPTDAGQDSRIIEFRVINERLQGELADRDARIVEINHRVRNNLQLIISLLNMQASKLQDGAARSALRETMDQVHAMGLIHDELNVSSAAGEVDFCISLLILCRHLNAAYGDIAEIEVEMGVGDCTIDVTKAVRLALVVNEVMTNALKHAFPDGRRGKVMVRLHRTEGTNQLSIADDGVGIGHNRVERTGSRLIGLLTASIHGVARCVRGPQGGTLFELAF